MKTLTRLHNALIDSAANSVDKALAVIGFLALYPLLFIAIFSSIGSFFWQKKYLLGFGYLILALIAFYVGKGIQEYLRKKKF